MKWAGREGLAAPKAPPTFAAREIPSGESILYIFRDGGFLDRPDVLQDPPEVRVNGKLVGGLRKGEYLATTTAPGNNTIAVDSIPRQSLKSVSSRTKVTCIDVQTLSGNAHYIMVRVRYGFGDMTPVLTVVPEEEALPALREMKPMP